MATTLYYGISGTTLTISRTSTTAAPNVYTMTGSGDATPPWYPYRNIITTLNFVNTPEIGQWSANGYSLFSGDYSVWTALLGVPVVGQVQGCLKALKTVTGAVKVTGGSASGLFAGCPLETVNLPNWVIGGVPDFFLWRNVNCGADFGDYDCAGAVEGSTLKTVNLKNWKTSSGDPVAGYHIGYTLIGALADSVESLDLTGWKFRQSYAPFKLNRHTKPASGTTPTYYGPPIGLKTLNLTNVTVDTVIGTSTIVSTRTLVESFKGCLSLETLTFTGFSMGLVTSADRMFQGCSSLRSVVLSGIIGSNATVQAMFDGCSSLTSISITGWSWTSSGASLDASCMFRGCANLHTITGFTDNMKARIANATEMFQGCAALQDLAAWGTMTGITQAEGMFDGCASLTSVTLMALSLTTAARMFRGCASLTTLDVTALDLSACTDLSEMFAGCSALATLDAGGIVSSACTDILGMFTGDVSLTTLDVSGWDTSGITDMHELFMGLVSLTALDLSDWDTTYVEDLEGMFYNCQALASVDISGFDTSGVTNFAMASNHTYKPMFRGCDALVTVALGSGFTTAAARALDDPANLLFYSSIEFAPAVNLTNYVYVASDGELAMLRSAEVAGTWRRGGEQMLACFAYRTDHGEADEQGLDITIDSTWRTGSTSSTRTLRIYIKPSTTPTYPTTPARAVTMSGDAGNTVVTLPSVGSGNFDLRVEFYDGEVTYVVFPSISTDTLLFSISPQGNAKVLGGLTIGGTLTIGTTDMSEAQLQALLRLV